MTDEQIAHLMKYAEEDALYKTLIRLKEAYEPEYNRILNILPAQDQRVLMMYVRIRESIEARIARTAYFLTPMDDDF